MKEKFIITIGREYGSGGGEIGRQLSKYFNIPCYDKELLTIAAKESGYCKEYFEKYDEKPIKVLSYFGVNSNTDALPINHKLFLKQFNIIQNLAKQESCIFIGRAANYALRDFENVVNVFVHGDFEFRRQRAIHEHEIKEESSKSIVKKIDKERSSYYNYYTDYAWGDYKHYHICLDTSFIGIDESVRIIIDFIEQRYK